jgi:hypothetical protein
MQGTATLFDARSGLQGNTLFVAQQLLQATPTGSLPAAIRNDSNGSGNTSTSGSGNGSVIGGSGNCIVNVGVGVGGGNRTGNVTGATINHVGGFGNAGVGATFNQLRVIDGRLNVGCGNSNRTGNVTGATINQVRVKGGRRQRTLPLSPRLRRTVKLVTCFTVAAANVRRVNAVLHLIQVGSINHVSFNYCFYVLTRPQMYVVSTPYCISYM